MIGGYTAPRGSRTDLGALLLGYYEDGRLRYAGKVGTGFTRAVLRDLAERLAPLRRDELARSPTRCASATRPGCGRGSWRRSASREWTRDGRLRHPRFLGLRDDKAAEEVVRE